VGQFEHRQVALQIVRAENNICHFARLQMARQDKLAEKVGIQSAVQGSLQWMGPSAKPIRLGAYLFLCGCRECYWSQSRRWKSGTAIQNDGLRPDCR
jgi:hypothetical protein